MNCSRETLSAHSGVTCVRCKGQAREGTVVRPAVHFIVLADKSGSMSSKQKMSNVKLSLDRLLEFMEAEDFLTVAPFNHNISHPPLIYGEACNENSKALIRQRMATIAAGGNTNIEAAIKEVPKILELELPSRPGGIKTGVLLLTDGEATEGIQTNEGLLNAQRNVLEAYPHLTLSTVGYGNDHNVELLTSLALSGSYNIVHNLNDVASVFGNMLGGLRTTIVEATRLIVPAHVRQRTSFKTTVRPDGLQEILIGDIIEGGEQVAILEGLTEADTLRLEYHSVVAAMPVVFENIVCSSTEEGQTVGNLAFLRCETMDILTAANTHMMGGGALPAELLAKIAALQALLDSESSCPTVDVLKQELVRAQRYLTMPAGPPELMRTRSNQLSQHTAYLGTGGGGGGMLSSAEYDDPPISSPFASAYQRNISIAIGGPSAPPYPPAANAGTSANMGAYASAGNPIIPLSISPISNSPDTPYPVQLIGDTGGSPDTPYPFNTGNMSNSSSSSTTDFPPINPAGGYGGAQGPPINPVLRRS